MLLKNWKDQKQLVNRIAASIKNNNIHHAYIIEGDNRLDKLEFAKDFLKAVNCENDKGKGCDECISCRKISHDNCEDLFFVEANGNSIKDQDMIDMQNFLRSKPNGPINMVIIENSEAITERGQNRILKTLEEPTGDAIIILLCENAQNLLETIRSRCVLYKLKNDNLEIDPKYYEMAKNVAIKLTEEDYFHRIIEDCDKIKTKEELELFFDGLELYYRNCALKEEKNQFLNQDDLIRFIEYIEKARFNLEYNMNVKYALKWTLLKIGG